MTTVDPPRPVTISKNQLYEIVTTGNESWCMEPKIDGVRLTIPARSTVGVLRSGKTIQLPDKFILNSPRMFDGELVVGGSFKETVAAINSKNGLCHTDNVAFHVFDAVRNTTDRYDTRKRWLANNIPDVFTLVPAPVVGSEAYKVMAYYLSKYEGVVLKRRTSKYPPGRTDWLKYVTIQTVSCIVTGYEQGSGSLDDTAGAFFLALLDPDTKRAVSCGKVGSGFTVEQRNVFKFHFDHGGAPFVMDLAYKEVTSNGALRDPRFIRPRFDLSIEDCVLSQLGSSDA